MRWPDRRILFSALTLAVVLGTPELLLRAFWTPPPEPSREVGTRRFVTWLSQLSLGRDTADELYRPDPELLWALRPDVRFESTIRHRLRAGEEQPIRITINEDGYRGARVSPSRRDPDERRVLCLGDSNFFGYPLDDADGFPAALEAALGRRSERPVTVINGGVPGYSVLQGRAWYDRTFAEHDLDWLLLSFLNNDAWRQPQSDRERMGRRRPAWIGWLSARLRLVQWGRSVLVPAPPREAYLPRVGLDEYEAAHRELVGDARRRGVHVLLLDFRAYPEYTPYSERLRRIAQQPGVHYLPVARRAAEAFADPARFERYAPQADRVRRRWTERGLRHRPHLRYYAEVAPEHLNEVGVAWLADTVAEMLLAAEAGPA